MKYKNEIYRQEVNPETGESIVVTEENNGFLILDCNFAGQEGRDEVWRWEMDGRDKAMHHAKVRAEKRIREAIATSKGAGWVRRGPREK